MKKITPVIYILSVVFAYLSFSSWSSISENKDALEISEAQLKVAQVKSKALSKMKFLEPSKDFKDVYIAASEKLVSQKRVYGESITFNLDFLPTSKKKKGRRKARINPDKLYQGMDSILVDLKYTNSEINFNIAKAVLKRAVSDMVGGTVILKELVLSDTGYAIKYEIFNSYKPIGNGRSKR